MVEKGSPTDEFLDDQGLADPVPETSTVIDQRTANLDKHIAVMKAYLGNKPKLDIMELFVSTMSLTLPPAIQAVENYRIQQDALHHRL